MEAGDAEVALFYKRCLELLVVDVHTEAEHVEFALGQLRVADDGVDLDARDELEWEGRRARGGQLADARERVVIGQCQGADAGDCGRCHEIRRLHDAIRSAAVGMEVEPRWIRGHDGFADALTIRPQPGGRRALRRLRFGRHGGTAGTGRPVRPTGPGGFGGRFRVRRWLRLDDGRGERAGLFAGLACEGFLAFFLGSLAQELVAAALILGRTRPSVVRGHLDLEHPLDPLEADGSSGTSVDIDEQ